MGAQLLLDNTQTCIYLLRERIKPAFQGTGTSKLTSQAHRAPQQIPLFTSSLLEDAESKSWKHENVYAPTLLRYVLLQLDALGVSEGANLLALLTIPSPRSSKAIGHY